MASPIFDSFCAALPLGPCFVELLHNPDRQGNPDVLPALDKRLIDEVLDNLGALSGKALAARSHRNYYEWRIMREGMRHNQVKDQGKCMEISVALIRMLPQIKIRGAYIGNPMASVSSSPEWFSIPKSKFAVPRITQWSSAQTG